MGRKLEHLANHSEKFKENYRITLSAKTYYCSDNFKRILLSIWPYILLSLVLIELRVNGLPKNLIGIVLMALKFLVVITSILLITVKMETRSANAEASGGETKLSN